MSFFKALTGVALCWAITLATPVVAQTFVEQQIAQCRNADGQVTPTVAISACTALLQSAGLDNHSRSVLHSIRGLAYADLNDFARAIADYSEVIRLNPQDEDGFSGRGRVYSDQRDYTRAIADYSEAIRLNPQDADVFFRRGDAIFHQGDYARAILDFSEAIRLRPEYARVFTVRAAAYERLGDAARASADRAEAARLQRQ